MTLTLAEIEKMKEAAEGAAEVCCPGALYRELLDAAVAGLKAKIAMEGDDA